MDFTRIVGVIGGIAVFLYGMRIMSEGLQKVAGSRMRALLSKVTNNRFAGVATGFVVTALIQSSSATTVMTVGFVNAGLLTVLQSVGIVMGANIGTTVTGWLVSLLGFKIKIAAFALPAIAVGFFARFLKREKLTHWGEVLVGFGFLFLGLSFLKDALPDMKSSPELAAWLHRYAADGYLSTLAVIGVGTVITMVVQSSSAVMAVTLTAAAGGLIDFPTAAALVLGENIGTTVTAMIASVGAQRTALRTAVVHTLFNVSGVLWVWLLFRPMCALVDAIVPGATGDVAALPVHLAAFHTLFNVSNTLLFLPFVGHLSRLVERIVPLRPGVPAEAPELRFIGQPLMATPDLAVAEARRETGRMLLTVLEMFDAALRILRNPDEKLGALVEQVEASEKRVDQMETDITHYLALVTTAELPAALSDEVRLLMGMVSDIERMGDHSERLVRLARKRYDDKLSFTDTAQSDLDEVAGAVRAMLELLVSGLAVARDDLFPRVETLEDEINALRRRIRTAHIERLQAGACAVVGGLVFLDMLTSFEKLGDHGFNVAEALSGRR